MKTKEFIKRVEELGFEACISGSIAYVLKDGRYTVAKIKTKRACAIDFFYHLNDTLDKEISEKLFDIIVEYAKTPIEDREEEKKFYLKNRWENKQLTLKEIEAIKEKFNTDLTDFLLVEVVDE